MHPLVAACAQRDEIQLRIAARMAPEDEMVYLQLLHAATKLAAPAVALQDLPVQFAVALCIQSEWWAFPESLFHEALRLTSDKKIFCCGVGRNL